MKGKELLIIAISAFILTVIWIASNVYHAYATSTIDELLQIQIIPIAPQFDEETIARLKQRKVIEPIKTSISQPSLTLSPSPVEPEIETVPTIAETEVSEATESATP
ncbi:MAG: hypothetical protein HYV40_04285 [Candidatus Levybacteria bacterium]|nr:hypothetical protein [Candidatus Levybacteria bacterium]